MILYFQRAASGLSANLVFPGEKLKELDHWEPYFSGRFKYMFRILVQGFIQGFSLAFFFLPGNGLIEQSSECLGHFYYHWCLFQVPARQSRGISSHNSGPGSVRSLCDSYRNSRFSFYPRLSREFFFFIRQILLVLVDMPRNAVEFCQIFLKVFVFVINSPGVEAPWCIQHCGVVIPQCIHHWGVETRQQSKHLETKG